MARPKGWKRDGPIWIIEINGPLIQGNVSEWWPLKQVYETRAEALLAMRNMRSNPQPIIMLGGGRYRVAKYVREE